MVSAVKEKSVTLFAHQENNVDAVHHSKVVPVFVHTTNGDVVVNGIVVDLRRFIFIGHGGAGGGSGVCLAFLLGFHSHSELNIDERVIEAHLLLIRLGGMQD